MNNACRNLSHPSLCRSLSLAMCITFGGLGASRADDQQTRMNESCGPQALVTAFALLGRQVEPSQCATLAATSPQGITTLSGLQEAARSLGASVRGMYLTPPELAMLGRVAILHAAVPGRMDHYLVFASSENGFFKVLNPTRPGVPQFYTGEQLRLMWDGNCLVSLPRRFLTC